MTMEVTARVARIQICPVKSMGPISLERATLSTGGFVGDRQFAVGFEHPKHPGEFDTLTRRERDGLVLFKVQRPSEELLILSYHDRGSIKIQTPRNPVKGPLVHHYQHTSYGHDLGDDVSEWLTTILGREKGNPLRLFQFVQWRKTNIEGYRGEVPPSGFLDRHPITVASIESLDQLNIGLRAINCPEATMEQFGTSITLSNIGAYAEHSLECLKAPGFEIRPDLPVDRCAYINVQVDSGTNLKSKGPLKHLKDIHPLGGVYFAECCSVLLESDEENVTLHMGQDLDAEFNPHRAEKFRKTGKIE